MRTVTLIIIHCSAVRPNQLSSAKDITQWHKARGWRTIGYHYVVRRDGTVENGRPIEQIGAHCVNHNKYSIGICYEGGLDAVGNPKDTRTDAQKTAIRQLIMRLKKTYPLTYHQWRHRFPFGKIDYRTSNKTWSAPKNAPYIYMCASVCRFAGYAVVADGKSGRIQHNMEILWMG